MTADELHLENARRELHDDVPILAEDAGATNREDDDTAPPRGQSNVSTSSRIAPADALPWDGGTGDGVDLAPGPRQPPTRTKREHAARFACPRCGAAAGEYCRRERSGRPRLSCHAERHAAALAGGAPGAQPRDTQLIPRQGGRVTRQGRPEGEARSA